MSVKFKKLMVKMKKKFGFSLIEMLIVIAIIAILVSIVVPIISNSVVKSAAATNAANLRSIEGKISVMRTTNPELFDDVVKEGLALDAFRAHMDEQGFSDITKRALLLKIFDVGSEANQFYLYNVYYNTADENGVLTISTTPVVTISNVPASKAVNAGEMILPADVPMTVYISQTGIVATYEYNGNSYTREDFAAVAETGTFSGPGTGGMTGADIEDLFNNLGNTMDCENNAHKFPDGSCTCKVCNRTIHGSEGYTSNGSSGHTCTRCSTSMKHQFIGSSCIASGCGYTCEHTWTKTNTNHTCNVCETTGSHTFAGSTCYTCQHTCEHNWIKTTTTHACSYCAPTPVAHDFYLSGVEMAVCQQCFAENPDYETCVTPDTLVTLADGTTKAVKDLTYSDQIIAWNHFTGEYQVTSASYIVRHDERESIVITLNFSDGTYVEIVGEHGFYDLNANKFVFINDKNVATYVGHAFAKYADNGYDAVSLKNYTIEKKVIASYSLASIACNNVMANGMFSLTPIEGIDSEHFFNFLSMGSNLKYDEVALAKDIATYGMFTYEDFADYMTESEYESFKYSNGEYLKIAMSKGYVTFEQILAMLNPTDLVTDN